jgi:molybdate/tungstate transport system substrate-binding protein
VDADFMVANPDVNVEMEGHGSIQVIRQVTELNQRVDLLMVADYSLIPVMMYSTVDPQTKQNYADYYIRFATNKLVLAYTNNSRDANEINASNWCQILTQPNVRLGLVNPELDSLGYRSLIAIQLAQDYYGVKDLFLNLVTNNFSPPISSIPSGSNYTISVPDVQTPVGNKITLRPSEVDLIPLLQEGYLDYCFLYESNAKQYGFNYIELPNQVNLGDPAYTSNYQRIQIVYAHQRFATVTLDRIGEPIYYGLTIPSNAPNPQLAEKFIQFLLSGQGKTDFAQAYQPVFTPSYTDNTQAIPLSLRSLVTSEP